jgi:hypothetical protein
MTIPDVLLVVCILVWSVATALVLFFFGREAVSRVLDWAESPPSSLFSWRWKVRIWWRLHGIGSRSGRISSGLK